MPADPTPDQIAEVLVRLNLPLVECADEGFFVDCNDPPPPDERDPRWSYAGSEISHHEVRDAYRDLAAIVVRQAAEIADLRRRLAEEKRAHAALSEALAQAGQDHARALRLRAEADALEEQG